MNLKIFSTFGLILFCLSVREQWLPSFTAQSMGTCHCCRRLLINPQWQNNPTLLRDPFLCIYHAQHSIRKLCYVMFFFKIVPFRICSSQTLLLLCTVCVSSRCLFRVHFLTTSLTANDLAIHIYSVAVHVCQFFPKHDKSVEASHIWQLIRNNMFIIFWNITSSNLSVVCVYPCLANG